MTRAHQQGPATGRGGDRKGERRPAAGTLIRSRAGTRLAGMVTAAALAAAALAIEGCGNKAPPRPPQYVRPKRIDDLKATPIASGIRLTWTRPSEMVDGSDLPDLDGILIRRATVEERSVQPRDLAFATIATIHLDDRERFSKVRSMSYDDRDVVAGRAYVYRAIAFTLDRYFSTPSPPVYARWQPPGKKAGH